MKPKFIRDAAMLFVAAHHQHPDSDTAITWAEKLWQRLCARGYGTGKNKKTAGTRQSIDHYKALTAQQKTVFDQFWLNFGKYGDKNRGAMVLKRKWEDIKPETQWLYSGALEETRLRKTRDTTPPYPEKWLNNYGWRNHPNPQRQQTDQQASEKQQKLRQLNSDLIYYKEQLKNDKSQPLQDIIKSIENNIKSLTAQEES